MKTPPRSGPITLAIPNVAPITPVKAGRCFGGALNAMRVYLKGIISQQDQRAAKFNTYAPDEIPAPPAPATARPTIKVVEFCDTAQMRLPTSKTNMLAKKVILRSKYLYASRTNQCHRDTCEGRYGKSLPLPQVDWKAARVRKKADPYQPTSSREWN